MNKFSGLNKRSPWNVNFSADTFFDFLKMSPKVPPFHFFWYFATNWMLKKPKGSTLSHVSALWNCFRIFRLKLSFLNIYPMFFHLQYYWGRKKALSCGTTGVFRARKAPVEFMDTFEFFRKKVLRIFQNFVLFECSIDLRRSRLVHPNSYRLFQKIATKSQE